MLVEYITLGIYLVSLPLLGILFSKFNSNLSDYVRGGGQVTWWLAGSSILMSGTSAFTFTGNASAAFEAGPTVLTIYAANVVALLLGGLFFGAWCRQTRGFTVVDVIRTRFGPAVEQFSAYTGVMLGPVAAAIQLWALSVFASAAFQVPLTVCILVIGTVVILYSTTGGKWAVMATDFVQSLILFAITILVAWLCYVKIGGFGAFFDHFSKADVAEDFKFVKDSAQFSEGKFSGKWIVVIFIMTIYQQLSMNSVDRYLVVKDGKEASKSGYLAAAMMLFGTLIWFFPPMVARFLYNDEIMAQDIANPATTSYSFIAQKVLPNGLMGVMIAAMFAATMSSMDSGLNRQVGIIARNVVPPLRRMFGRTKELTPAAELLLCKVLTIATGCLILVYSILFSLNKELALFDAYLLVNSIIGIPLLFPLLVGFWVKRLPSWSYFSIFGFSLIPSFYSYYLSVTSGEGMTIQDRAMWIFVFGAIGTVCSIPFYSRSPAHYKERVEEFFRLMRTPVDFEKEIGASRTRWQLRLLGYSSLSVGIAFLLFLLVPNDIWGRLSVVFIAAFCSAIGGLLLRAERIEGRREAESMEASARRESGTDAE